MTPSSAFATLISMKQGEKTQKIVAKYVYDRFRERERQILQMYTSVIIALKSLLSL